MSILKRKISIAAMVVFSIIVGLAAIAAGFPPFNGLIKTRLSKA